MRKNCLIIFFFIPLLSFAQNKYVDSLTFFQRRYVKEHEVVKAADKKFFAFYKIDKHYQVTARFEKISDTAGFKMKTSGNKTPRYFSYGRLYFNVRGRPFQLTIYQGEDLRQTEKYKYHLFIPFTDLTSGKDSYGGGRYLEFVTGDIINNSLVLDFNKAYNPYCAYASGFNCPIPPRENNLNTNIKAGERMFKKFK